MNIYLFRLAIIGAFMLLEVFSIMSFGIIGGFLPLIFLGVAFIGNPRFLLFLFWIWAVLGPIASYYVPSSISIILDAGLFFVLLATYILREKKFNNIYPIFIATIGLLVLTSISFLVNRPAIAGALHFTVIYFRFILVFLYTRYFFTSSDARIVYKTMIVTLIVQIIPNIGWLLNINPLPNGFLGEADFARGTVEGCNIVAYICIACICTFLAIILDKSIKRNARIIASIMIVVASIQLWMTYTLHAHMITVVCCGILILGKITNIKFKIIASLITVIILITFMQIRNQATNFSSVGLTGSALNTLNTRNIGRRWQMMLDGTKGRAYKEILLYSPKDMPYPIVGAGPGNFGSVIGIKSRAPLAEKYINYILDTASYRRRELTQGGSITSMAATGFLTIWSELGPFGFILYWGLHIYALFHIWHNLKKKDYKDHYIRILAEAFPATMIAWLMLNMLSDFCPIRVMHAGLWIWAAIIWDADSDIIFGKNDNTINNESDIKQVII